MGVQMSAEKGSEGKVIGRWGAAQETGKPSGSLDEILRQLEASIDDESKAADSYRSLADTIRRQLGLEYLHLASDIESIASDELNHHSRLLYIKSALEKLKKS
jgi:rubrerythrin